MAKSKIRLAADPAPNVTPIVAVMAKHNPTFDREVFLMTSIKWLIKGMGISLCVLSQNSASKKKQKKKVKKTNNNNHNFRNLAFQLIFYFLFVNQNLFFFQKM